VISQLKKWEYAKTYNYMNMIPPAQNISTRIIYPFSGGIARSAEYRFQGGLHIGKI